MSDVQTCSLSVGEDDGDDKTIESEGLSENEDKDNSDEDIFLGVSTDTCVTCYSNSKTSCEG